MWEPFSSNSFYQGGFLQQMTNSVKKWPYFRKLCRNENKLLSFNGFMNILADFAQLSFPSFQINKKVEEYQQNYQFEISKVLIKWPKVRMNGFHIKNPIQ